MQIFCIREYVHYYLCLHFPYYIDWLNYVCTFISSIPSVVISPVSCTAGSQCEELRPWQKSWGRRLGIRKGGIEPQESPLESLEHLPPKQESAYFTALCCHLHLWLYRELSPTTSFGEGVNLQLQLIIIPGRDRSVSTYKLLWRSSSLPDRLVLPHVSAYSLPTVRGMRCFKPSKNRFLRKVRKPLV